MYGAIVRDPQRGGAREELGSGEGQGSGARKTCDDAKSVTNRLIYGGAADRGKGLKKESRDGCCFGCFTVVFGGFGAGGPRRDGLCGWRCTTLFTTERWE